MVNASEGVSSQYEVRTLEKLQTLGNNQIYRLTGRRVREGIGTIFTNKEYGTEGSFHNEWVGAVVHCMFIHVYECV